MDNEIAAIIAEMEKEEIADVVIVETIDDIIENVAEPVEILIDENEVELVEITEPEEVIEDDVLVSDAPINVPTFNIGDEVQLLANATFASGSAIPSSLFVNTLYICAEKNGSYAISRKKNGKILGSVKPEYLKAYDAKAELKPEFKTYLILVKEDKLAVKSRPEDGSKTLTTLPYDGLYTVIGEHNDWCHLKIGGWIPMTAVKKI